MTDVSEAFPFSIPVSPIAASITMKYDIQLVVCRDGKEFAKNWSTLTLRVKRVGRDRQVSKFDITSTDNDIHT